MLLVGVDGCHLGQPPWSKSREIVETVSTIGVAQARTMAAFPDGAMVLRLRLVHQLALLLASTVMLAVMAMAGTFAWSLRSGFADYLREREIERLERLAANLATAVQSQGLERASGQDAWRGLLRALGDADGAGPPVPPGGEPAFMQRPPEEGPPPFARPGDGPPRDGERFEPPPRRPNGPPGREGNFGQRVTLLSLAGARLAGSPSDPHVPNVERPVLVDGKPVALLRMRVDPLPPRLNETGFLQRQYMVIAALAAALVLLALLAAIGLARRWTRPLLAMQAAAQRMAQGHLDERLTPAGAEELASLSGSLNAMAQSLQTMEQARRRWMAEIAHELRTPLAVLRGEIEALQDGIRPLGQPALVSLREEVAQLSRLVDDLHALTVADLGALPCRFAALDVGAVVQRAVERHGGNARTKGLSLALDVPEGAHTAVWDEGRIDQLLANLLTNSSRYTDAPGRIMVALRRVGDGYEISVNDSAPGVTAQQLPQLFEPLYRTDAARSRSTGGSGLGLAICAAIVRAHHGRIVASASALGGLRVEVWLPVDAQARAA